MPRHDVSNERVAKAAAMFPSVGNLTGDDLDVEMVGRIVHACAVSELCELRGWRRDTGSEAGWPVRATDAEVRSQALRWARLVWAGRS